MHGVPLEEMPPEDFMSPDFPPDPAQIGAAVVKIFVTSQRPSLAVPWQTLQVESTSGSGTFIMRRSRNSDSTPAKPPQKDEPPYWNFTEVSEAVGNVDGDLVLTAAHVIADARDIRVQLLACPGASPDKFVARVIAVLHDCDLALLEVLDSRCFEGAEPMPLLSPQGMLPLQSRVQVMGFPVGGDYLSVTEGVLSRIEVVEYSHSRRLCLGMTVDAAINAGNSGGPVADPATGCLVGVAHQKVISVGVENQGHAVPPCLIWRFLYGAMHGHAQALPSVGNTWQTLESATHREYLCMEDDASGVLVQQVIQGPGDPPSQLKSGDVMMKVGNYNIDNMGAVRVLGQRVALSAAQDLFYIGDDVRITVLREGSISELQVPLRHSADLVPRSLYGRSVSMQPEYFIFAGLVFVPLSADFLEQAWPNAQDRPPHLMELFYSGRMSPSQRQVLVLLSILADDTNAGHGSGYVGAPIVTGVAGTPVSDLQELASRLRQAVAKDEFVEIEYSMAVGPYTMVLRCADIAEADERIRGLYQLPALASPKLL